MYWSRLGWITLTHAHEIAYNSRVLNVVLVGYNTKFSLYKDPNITQYDNWWTPGYLPDILRIKTTGGDCEVGRLSQDVTLKTNSSLPLFPYRTFLPLSIRS
ncbi:hypothetical protein RSAG8_04186, partial [Rhizoctonia solani AG-8 WAC10335]